MKNEELVKKINKLKSKFVGKLVKRLGSIETSITNRVSLIEIVDDVKDNIEDIKKIFNIDTSNTIKNKWAKKKILNELASLVNKKDFDNNYDKYRAKLEKLKEALLKF